MGYGYDPLPSHEYELASPDGLPSPTASDFSEGSGSSNRSSPRPTWLQPTQWRAESPAQPTKSRLNVRIAALVTVYFALNLGLTFYNKAMLNDFPYPYFVTAIHAGSGVVGCLCLRLFGVRFENRKRSTDVTVREEGQAGSPEQTLSARPEKRTTLDVESGQMHAKDEGKSIVLRIVIVLLYSSLYAANIAVSNASLGLVSVPFHQIIRSTCPLFTLVLSFWLLSKRPQAASILALVPVVAGAALSCLGEMSFTSTGFLLTVLGTLLAAVKTVTTNLLQGGRAKGASVTANGPEPEQAGNTTRLQRKIKQNAFRFTALQLLEVMSPLACVQCLLVSYMTGELQQAIHRLVRPAGGLNTPVQWSLLFLLAGNGFIAFLLNVVSFNTNRVAGPLTMTVVGNFKQVVTILLAVQLYHLHVALINAVGIFVALAGTAWYGALEIRAKRT